MIVAPGLVDAHVHGEALLLNGGSLEPALAQGVTSVVVSHDVRGSFRVADRVALLWQGKLRAVGTAEEFLASRDPAVQQFLERDLEMAVIQSESEEQSRHGS